VSANGWLLSEKTKMRGVDIPEEHKIFISIMKGFESVGLVAFTLSLNLVS